MTRAERFSRSSALLNLKSLVSFDDVMREPIAFQHGYETPADDMYDALEKSVQSLRIGT